MAARQIKNILVGVGKLELNPTSGTSFDQSQYTDIGFTIDGVEITLEPNIVDIEIDQLGDAAKLIHQSTKVMLKTTMAEATLENLAIAWGYAGAAPITTGTNNTFAANITGDGVSTNKVFSIALFDTGQALERSLRFTGKSPDGHPRTYVCTRVVSVASSASSYKRGAATVFPVEFRILPDSSRTGSEYGTITDAFTG